MRKLKKGERTEERRSRKELVPLLINSSFDSYTVVVTVSTHHVTTWHQMCSQIYKFVFDVSACNLQLLSAPRLCFINSF